VMAKRLMLAALLVLSGMPALRGAEAKIETVLLQEDFNKKTKGVYAALLKSPHIQLAEGAGPDGSDAIRVAYVGYEKGSKRVTGRYPLKSKVEQATLSFDVRFDKDFQWVKGGKLHGLAPKKPITGGKKQPPDGWSARVTFKEDGKCATYLYHQSKPRKYGTGSKSKAPVFRAGTWHHVTLAMQINDPGKPNGLARIYIDNKLVVSSDKIDFRGTGGDPTLIQTFLFSTFHGGSSPKYTPVDKKGKPTTVYAYFDNFRVVEGVK
jgi:hypothetical protein